MHLVFFTDENDCHLTLIEKPLCDDYCLVCCVTLSSSIVMISFAINFAINLSESFFEKGSRKLFV